MVVTVTVRPAWAMPTPRQADALLGESVHCVPWQLLQLWGVDQGDDDVLLAAREAGVAADAGLDRGRSATISAAAWSR